MKKTNILLLTDCLADLAGGAEKQIYELAKRLDKNKFNVYVISLDTWGKAPREIIETTGASLHIFKVVRIYGLSGLIEGLRFKKFLKTNNIDVILTYHFSSDIWGTFWGHLAGVKTIMSNRRDMGFWRNNLHVLAYKLINNWVSGIIVVAKSIKDLVIETEHYPANRIHVIYNGVTIPNQTTALSKEQINLPATDTVIIHVANLKPVKGHIYLLKAFAQVVKKFSSTKLVLIGKDEYDGLLQQMAKDLNISDKVVFLGKRSDITQLLPLADICVLPSLSEGMSNSILEYMAAQKPVIATKVGGNPELIDHGVTGLLIDKEDDLQLADALEDLVANPDKRLSMGKQGYNKVNQEFSMEAMIKHYENIALR